ncbi:MAG: radical SAM family heme chaperone HemW [Treponema sp.]|nr:radical SAM family heme chaperone HemW [Treponema sp.]
MGSIGLYVHIPFCLAKCGYCDFFSVASASCGASDEFVPDSYIKALLREAEFYRSYYGIDSWRTVYIGGGTPSLMSARQIEWLLEGLLKGTQKDPLEFTIEMNPESLNREKLLAARDCGVSRLSLGIQSLCQNALTAVGRHCTALRAVEALDLVGSSWTGDLSLDAIAGLPNQNRDEFEASLKRLLDYEPEHFSLYSLMVEDGTPLERAISCGKIPFDEDEADGQWLLGRDILEQRGFFQYEVSNFALRGHESLHNGSYWKQDDYAGVGAGASGSLYSFDGLGGGHGVRWTGSRDIGRYTSFWNEFSFDELCGKAESFTGGEKGSSVCGAGRLGLASSGAASLFESVKGIPAEFESLDLETLEFEYLMMALRTLEGVNSNEYKRRFSSLEPWNGDLRKRLWENPLWKEFEGKKMCLCRESVDGSINFALNRDGLLFLNSLLRNF